MKKIKQFKEWFVKTKGEVTFAFKTFTQFIEASALLGLTAYGLYAAYTYENGKLLFYFVVVAAVVVGLRGAHEYWKHLTRKG